MLLKLLCIQGGDNVIECVHEDSDAENGVKAYRSWNIPGIKRNRREDVSWSSNFFSFDFKEETTIMIFNSFAVKECNFVYEFQ